MNSLETLLSLYFFQDAGEFDKAIGDRQDRAQKAGCPVQPYILVMGPTTNDAVATYVIVNKAPWKTSSVLQAVDICLKTCFALNCLYPPESYHLWLLIQNYIYKITLDEDVSVSSVTTFMQKLDAVTLEE